jgi:hypothetical protein
MLLNLTATVRSLPATSAARHPGRAKLKRKGAQTRNPHRRNKAARFNCLNENLEKQSQIEPDSEPLSP